VHVTNPLPLGCLALLLVLPGVWLAGRQAARALGLDRASAAVAAPGLSVSLWLLAMHVVAYSTRSFVPGLVAGTLAVGAVGYVTWFRARGAAPPPGPRPTWWMWAGAALATVLVAPMAIGWSFHDEANIGGHMAFIAEMQNGVYPPRSLTFPQFELRYHYGFDLLAAAVSGLTRLRVDNAIDAVTLPCFGWLFAVAWRLGNVTGGSRAAGPFTAALVSFAGGLPFVCAPGEPIRVPLLVGQCSVEGLLVNPPFLSYFFQHPWTVGAPLALTALLVASEAPRGAGRLAALGLVLLALTLTQLVLFVTVAAALLVAEVVPSVRGSLKEALDIRVAPLRALGLLVVVGLTLAVARRLGGFFAPMPDGASSGIVVHLGVVETLAGAMRWHIASFGALLPLGVAGLLVRGRARVALGALVAASLLVLNTVRYSHSWDIVKFGTVTALSLAALAGLALSRLWSARPRWLTRPAAVALLAVVLLPGIDYPVLFAMDAKGLDSFPKTAWVMTPADSQVVAFLRTRVAPTDVVYRTAPPAYGYSPWAGLPVPWVEVQTRAFGFAPARMDRRELLLRELPAEPQRYLGEGIRWLVLDPRDTRLRQLSADWVRVGRARVALTVEGDGGLEVVEILR
jgi:hypothetical protein